MSTQQRRELTDRSVMAPPRVIAQTAFAVLLLGAAVASFFLVYALLPEANQFGRGRAVRDLMAALRNLSQCPEKGTASTRCNGQVLTVEELLDQMDKRDFTFFGAGFFDTYIAKDAVVLKRRPCAKADVAGMVIGWSLWSTTSKPLTPQQQSSGEFFEYLPFDDRGYMVGETCLMAIHLPIENIRRLFLGLLDGTRSKLLWKLDWHQ